jgi:hypothetical protein
VQFGAEVNYWFLTTIPGTVIVNSVTNLGSLQYNYQLTGSPGAFSSIVNYSPTTLLGATGNGFLMITGEAFVAGDPFDITVTSVPEPSSIALAGMGGLAILVLGVGRRIRGRLCR